MAFDWDKFPTSGYKPGIPYVKRLKAVTLRRKYRAEVNDTSWRDSLKPVKAHPRRDKRGQSKPR